MRLKPNSILVRIIWLHILTVGLATVIIPLRAYEVLDSIATEFENQELRQHADIVGRYIEPQGDGTLAVSIPADLRALYESRFAGFALAVMDDAGRVLYSTVPGRSAIQNFDPHGTLPSFFQSSNEGMAYYGANIPKRVGGRTVFIQVARYVDHPDVITDNVVAEFLRRIVWVVFPLMVLLIAVDFAIVRRALRPVKAASNLAQSIGPSRLDQRIPTDGIPSEILALVNAFNQALERLERGFRLQREFTADAAHELRTPLSILRMRVDRVSDPALGASLRRDIDAMTRVVNQLLELAELENAIADLNEIVDLHQLCAEVVALVAPIALTQGKQLALTGTADSVWINGNGTLLFQAVRNIVDNAIAHTGRGTTVEVNVRPTGTVRVLDEGPGVPEAERELIFLRFWRRNRDKPYGGAGLGLSIVSRIIEAHGGTVRVENRSSGGAIFLLDLVVAAEFDSPAHSRAKQGTHSGSASRGSEAVSA